MHNQRKRLSRACLLVGVFALLSTSARLSAADGPPEIGGASIVAEGATLVYGANFDDEAVWAHVQPPPKSGKDEKPWGENELKTSLERVLAGKPEYPPEPSDKDRGWRKVAQKEPTILLCDTGGSASSAPSIVKMLRVKNSKGVSKAWRLNAPEIWGASPRQVVPGESLTVWGVNIGDKFALVSKDGKLAAICEGFRPFCSHSHRPEIKFIRLLRVPDTVAPGAYSLYNWNGFGDWSSPAGWGVFGDICWSEPSKVEVVKRATPPEATVDVKEFGAKGDGLHDDTEAIEKAIKAAEQKKGQVFLPGGRYIISRALTLPEGVGLAGVSSEATVIEVSPWKEFEGTLPGECFSRPPDYSPETYKRSGWGVDWLMVGLYKDQTPMIRLQP
ncbi:MAG: glycosyl hydrolase family 28-related protein, partial [Kiritimatiellota bacterium]|nr:glycosyl hydrolase family 28-related protein [Kiritimatiellota bacterium]